MEKMIQIDRGDHRLIVAALDNSAFRFALYIDDADNTFALYFTASKEQAKKLIPDLVSFDMGGSKYHQYAYTYDDYSTEEWNKLYTEMSDDYETYEYKIRNIGKNSIITGWIDLTKEDAERLISFLNWHNESVKF